MSLENLTSYTKQPVGASTCNLFGFVSNIDRSGYHEIDVGLRSCPENSWKWDQVICYPFNSKKRNFLDNAAPCCWKTKFSSFPKKCPEESGAFILLSGEILCVHAVLYVSLHACSKHRLNHLKYGCQDNVFLLLAISCLCPCLISLFLSSCLGGGPCGKFIVCISICRHTSSTLQKLKPGHWTSSCRHHSSMGHELWRK